MHTTTVLEQLINLFKAANLIINSYVLHFSRALACETFKEKNTCNENSRMKSKLVPENFNFEGIHVYKMVT